jgi:AbrB family looped-hinge helix DNA binding protein
MASVRARVSDSGRLSIPSEFRKAVGLENGGDVVVELYGREIRIRTVDEVVAQAQALTRRFLAGRKNTSVDAFITERRRQTRKE